VSCAVRIRALDGKSVGLCNVEFPINRSVSSSRSISQHTHPGRVFHVHGPTTIMTAIPYLVSFLEKKSKQRTSRSLTSTRERRPPCRLTPASPPCG
jgi:hypothetical protein